jgi:CelD/BcsL family acetyltransferase involved in cellulose biosynthesis
MPPAFPLPPRLRFQAAGPGGSWPTAPLAGTPFQSPGFVAAWQRTRGAAMRRAPLLLLAEDADGLAAALPLEIDRRGPFRVARFPAETHANANGWCLRPGASAPVLDGASLAAACDAAGLRIDALDLHRMPDPASLGPGFAIRPAPEERFAISLAGGLETVLARGNAKRKRKKFRSQQRFFEAQGGYVFGDTPAADRAQALATFFAQKRARFADLSLPNPFADRGIEAFLADLFGAAGIDTRLYTIVSAGSIKAMMGGVVADGVFWGMFSSFADDADADVSPGELLLWHLVEQLSAEGLALLDLGPGEERYKRSWCDRVVPQYDAVLALTTAGRAYVAAARLRGRLVARIKSDTRLRGTVQRLRRIWRGD